MDNAKRDNIKNAMEFIVQAVHPLQCRGILNVACRECPIEPACNSATSTKSGRVKAAQKWLDENANLDKRDVLQRKLEEREALDKEIESLEKVLHPKLHLTVNGNPNENNLNIMFGDKSIGRVNRHGKCYFLSTQERRDNWEEWVLAGREVDGSRVLWKDTYYWINYGGDLSRADSPGHIYSFKTTRPSRACSDPNIKKLSNGTPIMY